MSLQQHFDGSRPTATGAPVRVFADVARTPRTPAPRGWNNPAAVAVVGMPLSVCLTWIPFLPPLLGVLALALVLGYAAAAAVGWFSWPQSRDDALAEAAWVAAQSGYRVDLREGALRWFDRDGTARCATVLRGAHGWDLVLEDRPAGEDVPA
ncbi:hypothetical protein MRU69_07825 [Kocuria flava]|uniref:hypothetical protein n=1 Tax=Kocuria flava TaxID=446860 RepID=UPI001FF5906A|nr:hypothetical protein [Kocuria flava]MCJ8504778.1 hypothetical protein [Kocuria flava]